ncbi:TetR/AcrR family transcriptional regulator [Williamsia soli]|uniref:TetR/AcrR family transcriptional regulator n=1 Tax=Williamsia soli TaxID=364929 RepID=UPI001A9E3C83|nr:TetR/AcrR family transcriptional regulator [Williamsia soli]
MARDRPYETLLVKGEERKRLILDVAQRLLARNGWRNTTLSQIAKEAGVSSAGLLHHFESKAQLLHAVLEMRDADDLSHANRSGDLLEEIVGVAERFERSPELIGTFAVLQIENLEPDAPLHDRLVSRHRAAISTVAAGIRRGQQDGRYRTDLDPDLRAVEIVAFLNGMETSWLLDRTIPLTEVFREYSNSLARDFAPTKAS